MGLWGSREGDAQVSGWAAGWPVALRMEVTCQGEEVSGLQLPAGPSMREYAVLGTWSVLAWSLSRKRPVREGLLSVFRRFARRG